MTSESAPSKQEILLTIAKKLGRKPEQIDLDAPLSMEREHAQALFKELARRFGLAGEISFEEYFNGFRVVLRMPEFSPILRLLYPDLQRRWRTDPPRRAMTVSDIVAAVQSGVWRDPPPPQPPEPIEWAGHKTLAPIFKALNALSYALAYLLALGFFVWLAFTLGKFFEHLVLEEWILLPVDAIGIIWPAFFILCMFENTQRYVEDRFGRLWDWRRGKLREPRRETIAQ